MRSATDRDRRLRQTLLLARLACLLFGLALLAWGLGPLLVRRLVGGYAPDLTSLKVGTVTLLLGLGYMGLCLPVGRGTVWALWTAGLSSFALLIVSIGFAALGGTGQPLLFSFVLAASTVATSCLALDALPGSRGDTKRRPEQRPDGPERHEIGDQAP